MDWEPIVSHLAQGFRPALIVDGAGRVRFLNASMEKLLGKRLEDLTATRWLASCVSPGGVSGVRQLLGAGFRGEATAGDVPLVTREGRRLTMHAELAREIHGRSRALVVIAQGVREVEPTSAPEGDCRIEVTRPEGTVKEVRFLDPGREVQVGQRVEDLLASLGCAAAMRWVGEVLGGRSRQASDVLLPEGDEAFRVVTAEAVDDASARVTVRYLAARLVPELVDAKAARTAADRALSERERQVLTLLLRGRGVEDIATMLEIAPRTVKFHQANVLQKLGADSRLDLLRVVL
ncbi:MAG TPA: helix-turn-helix transcriptional regulator [Polyangiaceae bacterium]|jgi:DNA-binding CsgD family transcriptional regulator|nr:helix-turn-helix transcriptional regulator [Polyangiaceae bacterium]